MRTPGTATKQTSQPPVAKFQFLAIPSSVHSVCYSPDGSQLVVAAGERLLIYDPNDGSLLNTLKAHKDIVNAVVYSRDGKRFASGAADKMVIVWSPQLEGLLKYS